MFLIRIGAIEGYQSLVTSLGGNPVKLLGEVGFIPSNYVKEKDALGLQNYDWYRILCWFLLFLSAFKKFFF